jgi:hypothetical protein
MNRITPQTLYELLPAIIRMRDADEGEPLRALFAVLAREGGVIEENIEQLLDDLFIETAADWATPYIGGVIGYRALHEIEGAVVSPRTEVANTIGYRRRKGTAAVLEQLAHDVTGWPARVVEYFQLVATCQHMNHIRPNHHWAPDLADPLTLEPVGRAFDPVTRTVDVRSINRAGNRKSTGGKHNLPNTGLYLWRLGAMRQSNTPASMVDARRYRFDPLGADRPLINRPLAEDHITHLARPENVPGFLTRRQLHAEPSLWYPRAFEIFVDGVAIPVEQIQACDLADDGPDWNHSPHTALGVNFPVRVDPERGRFAFPDEEEREVRTTFHLGFPGQIGGGEYNRAAGLAQPTTERPLVFFPHPVHATIQDALNALPAAGGIVEIRANDVFPAPVLLDLAAGAEVELRAADGLRPILNAAAPFVISGGADARVSLNGLVLAGDPISIEANGGGESLGEVTLRHMTLVPGLGLTEAGAPASPEAVSLQVSATGVELTLDRSISGPLRMVDTTNADIRDSLIDAAALDTLNSAESLAISGIGGAAEPAGALTIIASTVIGRITARAFPLVSNSILHARASQPGEVPVRAFQRQDGCMRFSFVPQGSITPRRYRCQPQLAIDQAVKAREAETGVPITQAERALITSRIARWLIPSFTALSYAHPAYAQLREAAPAEIRTGADDESEMGGWHHLFQPQREANLRIRLDEYLRFGLEADVFFET